jgi:hypothetical protein
MFGFYEALSITGFFGYECERTVRAVRSLIFEWRNRKCRAKHVTIIKL